MSGQKNETVTAIDGIRVGHYSDFEAGTGLTVVLFDLPAVGAADIIGMATSTRQIDSLNLIHPVKSIHAICFTGGSAFGLDASSGVSRFLEEKNVGLNLYVARVPVVPTAAIYDLSFMNAGVRPSAQMAYNACLSAGPDPVEQGCVGAGTGATAGKLRGVLIATKTAIGSSMLYDTSGVRLGALVVANPFGDILNDKGRIIAGARECDRFLDARKAILAGEIREHVGSPGNTTLCLVVTDAKMDKTTCMQVARMAGSGISRHISPFSTPFDGDIIFCLSIGEKKADPLYLGVLASKAAGIALVNAAKFAKPMGGLPSSRNISGP